MDLMNEQKRRALEEIIGYRFQSPALLCQAMTHSSYSKEMKQKAQDIPHYERLEFLGDAVLELVTSEMLYEKFGWDEGKLTKKRAAIVCEESLSYIAKELSLGDYLVLSRGEDKTGGRMRPSILCDVVESLIGAVYLDGGMEKARDLIYRLVFTRLKDNPSVSGKDYKTLLQEKVQAEGTPAPVYRVISEDGPPHRRVFTVELLIGGEVAATGIGTSKKQAEQEAAGKLILPSKSNT